MKRSPGSLWSVAALAFFVLVSQVCFAQHPPICDVQCGPDPGSGGYGSVAAARSRLLNARGYASSIAPKAAPLSMQASVAFSNANLTNIGSQSFNYAIPVLSLSGRAGLDLNLTLYYNSRVWDVDTNSGTITFNADRDFPSYGFRLDFGFLEYDPDVDQYIVTEADGTKRVLVNTGSGYDTTDGSFIHYQPALYPGPLTYRNGTTVYYEVFPSQQNASPRRFFRPDRIEDTNGNFIWIDYVSGKDQAIADILDTLGRVILFDYNTNGQLIDIRQGSRYYATFHWTTIYSTGTWYNFTGLTPNAVPTGALNVIDTCTYANNTAYRFTYGDWGIINRIDNLSSTGVVRSYVSYNFPAASSGALSDAPAYTAETVSPGGTATANWTYSFTKSGTGVVTGMTISDPVGNSSTTSLDSNGMLSSVQVTDSSNVLLRTTSYIWTTVGNNTVPDTITITNDASQQSKQHYSYDSYGNVTDLAEYDFGLVLKRHTVTSYLADDPSGSGYVNLHILDRPLSVKIEDANNNIAARTDFAYDSLPLYNTSDIPAADRDANYGVSFTKRGNLTSVTRYLDPVTPGGGVTRTFQFDSLGNVRVAQLDCCNQKTFNFSSTTQWTYPDSVVRGTSPQFTASYTYDFNQGLMLSSTDENGQTTTYAYDVMNRQTGVTTPMNNVSSAQVTANTVYGDDVLSPTVTKSNTGGNSLVTVATFDGLGRNTEVDTKNGSTLVSTVKYSYNSLGQRIQASNPFASGETQVNTAFVYDGLSRIKSVTPLSGGGTQYSYVGNYVQVTDPAGKQRRSYTDALGRLTGVEEPGQPGVGSAVNYATLQADGNFVVYSPNNTALWATGTGGQSPTPGPLEIQEDGNLVLYSFRWQAGVYAAPTPGPYPPQACSVGVSLNAPQTLNTGQCITSPKGQYMFYMQSDGNLYIYDIAHNVVTWATNTSGHSGAYATMQTDGNFVVYSSGGTALWSSGTSGTYAERLEMEDDGRIIIYRHIWASGTSHGFGLSSLSHPSCDVGNGIGNTGVLGAGSCIVAPNGHFEGLMQTDGNFVLYDLSTNPPTSYWSTGTTLTPMSPGVTLATTYTYDVLDHLTGVSQAAGLYNGQSGSAQSRTYNFDPLGRLTSATTPESGTVTNYYTKTDGTACSGDPSLVCRIQDARGIVKTLAYDGINRLSTVTYSDSTPGQTYQYDQGGSSVFALDRITKVFDGANSQTFTYDNWGQIRSVSNVIDSNIYMVQYAYNAAGEVASITYPTNRVVNQTYDGIGRLSSVCDGASGCTGTTYLSNITYNGAFEPKSFNYGNNDLAAFTYNDHLQISSVRYYRTGSSSDILNLTYDYGTSNNGQIQAIHYYTAPGTQNEDTTKSEVFTYDQYMRLSAAHTGTFSSSTPGTWSLTWTFDRFGNRLTQNLVGGNTSGTSIGQAQFTVDPNTNHITNTGFSYDLAGNLTADGTNTYVYDGAGRLKQLNSGAANYTYFGHLRIKKAVGSTTTTYIYSGEKPIVEYVNGSLSKEYIYSGSQMLAEIASGAVTYHHPDHLSNRADADASGNILHRYGHAPFGETWYDTGISKWKFTSYERDSESGLDYAQFRYYASGKGRFLTADPMGGSPISPQSLNRYTYAGNDPVDLTDPLGLYPGEAFMSCTWVSVAVWEGGGAHQSKTQVDICFYTWEFVPLDMGSGSPQPNPSGGGAGGGGKIPKVKVNLKALFDCILSQFGVIGLSFSPSQPAGTGHGKDNTNGSFTGLGVDRFGGSPAAPFIGGLDFISVMNNITDKNILVTASEGLKANSPRYSIPPTSGGKVSVGLTYDNDPYINYQANSTLDPAEALGIQIWELGNSLAVITGWQPPAVMKDTSEDPGSKLLDCYNNGGPQK